MSKIILDTNSLIYAVKKHIDLSNALFGIDEINGIIVPECVASELRGLSIRNPHARAALELISRFEIINSEGRGDDCILETARRLGAFILTNDRGLLTRAKSLGIRNASIRSNGTVRMN
ncbi:MAG: PIN domain-containing protein [Thermoplasmatales archaeon]|nr:PIN domain-containing protein [Thermoplasmatales archaeon]MCW6170706.1 PIN domain-containing protein [Thermoplasmatales archaeon]